MMLSFRPQALWTAASFCERSSCRPLATCLHSMAGTGGQSIGGAGAAELRKKDAGQCSRDTPLLAKEELEAGLKSIPSWSLNPEATQISKSFVAKNFVAAIAFFQRVAEVAEEANHHPDLHLTGYRNVKVDLSTHAIGGISEQDLIIAARIDALPVDFSPKWLKQQQEQGKYLQPAD